MATLTRVSLVSTAPYHFGRRGVGLNETMVAMPADGLFSALCTALAALKGLDEVAALLALFPQFADPAGGTVAPPFRITSLMPSAGGIDLLPMPLLRPKLAHQGVGTRKELKRIAWASQAVFAKLVAGDDLTNDHAVAERTNRTSSPYTVQNGAVWVTASELARLGGRQATLWRVTTRPRVTVDRRTGASAAFSSGSVHFTHGERFDVQLYALIRWEAAGNALRKDIKAAFAELGATGIGGERSYGLGQFSPEFTTTEDVSDAREGAYWTTLCPYVPQQGEQAVFGPRSRYSIVLSRGWLSLPGHLNLRRPTLRMVNTGAVLHGLPHGMPVGCLADVTPDILRGEHVIRRYGLAWPVPVAAAALKD